MLDDALDVFRMRQYFNVITRARELRRTVREDTDFLRAAGRALASRPSSEDDLPHVPSPFPPLRRRPLTRFAGRRLGLVATGGSGALASVVGVARALEESDLRPDVIAVCSGSALFGFPLATGRPATEVAEFVLGLVPGDYLDPGWRRLAASTLRRGRGFGGLLDGRAVEATFQRFLGDVTLGELAIPCYAPIWSIERNQVEFIGPARWPDLPVARAIRMAIALPLFIEPVELDGEWWCDGGIVDILPVEPVLDIEPPCDVVVAVNGFYPPGFEGEDASGWRERTASILHVAGQVRTCQQLGLARAHLQRLHAQTELYLVEPVAYTKVRGMGFYRQFFDTAEWADFMRAGRRATHQALRGRGRRS